MTVLSVRSVSKAFGGVRAIADVSFSIGEGEELGVKLRRERLVVRNNQRLPVHVPDDVRHGEGLARTGDPEQRLMFRARLQRVCQLRNRLRLVAGGFVGRDEVEHSG